MKANPNAFIAGQAPAINDKMMPLRISSTDIAQTRVIQ